MPFVISNAFVPPTVPAGFCNLTPQQQINYLWENTQFVSSTSFTNLLIQAAEPNPIDRDKAWLRLTGAGLVPEFLYTYAMGSWVSLYSPPAGGNERMLWVGTEAELWSYDGGDGVDPSSVAPTATTGSFWQRDTDFDGRVPVGTGTVPGSDPSQSITVATNYGEASHTILQTELPATLNFTATLQGFKTNLEGADAPQWLAPAGSGGGIPTTPATETASFSFINAGGGVKLQMLPAARGVIYAKRTQRTMRTPI